MNLIKKVYNWWNKPVMPPVKTIQEIIEHLNSSTPGQTWQPIDGVQSFTTVDRKAPNSVSFNIGSGLVVKGFVNTTTGEIKVFPAKLFGFPEQDT